ncbi:MAG: AsmA family protein [Candidatus Saccharibacteria bacterium]|nr:AsmA family protein [Rhodoferax sp.]
MRSVMLGLLRTLMWAGAAILTLLLVCVLVIAVFGWNWMRGPLEQMALQKTGRILVIEGDLGVKFGWPITHMQLQALSFANPGWAQKKQMLTAQGIDVGIDVPRLFSRKLVFPEVRLTQADISLERSSEGRKSWLLDLEQTDEEARIDVGQVSLGRGTVGFEDPSQETSLHATITTDTVAALKTPAEGLQFAVQGKFKGLPVQGQGNGGPVLALRDTLLPYPLKAQVTVGRTSVALDGTVTDLQTLSAVDLHMAVRGESLEHLYPVLGIALPSTRPYTAQGRLLHSGALWRFEKFVGRIGGSDVAGFAQVTAGDARPQMTAELQSNRLALDDLGPVIGSRPGSVKAAVAQPQGTGRVLPDLPFHTDRWGSVDADVELRAKSLVRAKALPLENLLVQLRMRDSVLTLDPLNFGLAGGELNSKVTLDGQKSPIQAHAQMRARKVQLAQLFPTLDLGKSSIGQVNGEFDLTGSGGSVGTMLAGANGKLSLVVSNGQVSRLMMEKAGLHLWEIFSLSVTGDQLVQLRCGVADFDVKQGSMQARALVLDTQVTTLLGTGSVNLKTETIDLILDPRTKTTSPLALHSPIYVQGSFAKPKVKIDTGRVLARAAGALGLGLINPLLALVPLVDAGPGKDSDCGQLVRDAKVWKHKDK